MDERNPKDDDEIGRTDEGDLVGAGEDDDDFEDVDEVDDDEGEPTEEEDRE